MRYFIAILLLASSVAVRADTDTKPHVSPDGRFAIYNVGDTAQSEYYFEIKAKDGTMLLSSKDGTGEHWRPSHATQIMWSGDKQSVLFCYEDGKYKCTGIYSFAAHKFLSLDHVLDGYTVPVRWVGPRTFVVKNSTPMGGKALGGIHIWRQTYRITPSSTALRCIHTGPTTVTEEVPYWP